MILHVLPVTCGSISPLPHAPMHWTISYRAVQLHINHANNISPWFHIAACYGKTITFVTLNTYFLFKSLCNRNKMFMKNSSKIFKVFEHGQWCKLGYLFLVSRYCKSLYFSASTFFVAISYLHKNRKRFWYFLDSSFK